VDKSPDIILDMANLLPEKTDSSTVEVSRLSLQKLALAEALADGKDVKELARMIAKGDPERYKYWRRKIRRWAYYDKEFRAHLGIVAEGTTLLALPNAAYGLARRAARGNVPAVKLLFEATNFHNPKVKHEHSGEVKVKLEVGGQALNAPRPAPVEDVIEAEVVE